MYPGTKRKWIWLQPEVGNHLSLWYIRADNQTNRPYSFLKSVYKILQKPKHRKLKDEKYYERLIFLSFVSCLISCKIYSSHSRISPVLRQNRNKTETRSRRMENFFQRHGPSNNCHNGSKLGVKCFFGKKIFILTSFPWLLNLWTTRHKILSLISVVIKPVSVLAI